MTEMEEKALDHTFTAYMGTEPVAVFLHQTKAGRIIIEGVNSVTGQLIPINMIPAPIFNSIYLQARAFITRFRRDA